MTYNKKLSMSFIILTLMVCTLILACAHFILSCKIDYLIAKWMGDVQKINESGWVSYGEIKWTLTSLLGPAWALNISIALFLSVIAGFSLSMVIINLFYKLIPLSHTYYWLICIVVFTWIIRIPLPMRYSLFYFSSVKY